MAASNPARRVAVIGAGTMGTGIAIVAARGGSETLVYDVDAKRGGNAVGEMRRFFDRSVELKRLAPEQAQTAMAGTRHTASLADLADADLVIEAIYEDFATKCALIRELDQVLKPQAVVASNTSTLSITGLAGASQRPQQFVGLHFCLPAQLMKLVEVTAGLLTSAEAYDFAWRFCEGTGQVPVKTKDTPGFILNRFVIPFNNDAIRLVERGAATPDAIDRAIRKGLGHAMGPLQLVDMVGLDTQILLCEAFYAITRDPRHVCPNLVRQMVAAGQLGRKSGQGFYKYESKGAFGAARK